jgi:hypothetical protein
MKTGAGTSRSDSSLVWFTLGRGVLNEIVYQRIDSPCTRDACFIVTATDGFFSDERRDTDYTVAWLEDGIPAFRAVTTCESGRYRFEKTIVTDDRLNTVLQRSRFAALSGEISDYRVFATSIPTFTAGASATRRGWRALKEGRRCLRAVAMWPWAVLATHPFLETSVGFLETSDALSDLKEHGRLTETHLHAEDGNIALIGEIDLRAGAEFTIAYGFGLGPSKAAHHAYGALQTDFEEIKERYMERWQEWQHALRPLSNDVGGRDLYRISAATMRVHANKSTPGAAASLAVPWGEHRGDEDLLQGAYRLVWPRDLVNHATGLLAAGDVEHPSDLLAYLRNTQEDDGHWPQNMWISGSAFWTVVQLDQTAQPILLADLMRHTRVRVIGPSEAVLADGAEGRPVSGRIWPRHRARPMGREGRLHGTGACSMRRRRRSGDTFRDRGDEAPGPGFGNEDGSRVWGIVVAPLPVVMTRCFISGPAKQHAQTFAASMLMRASSSPVSGEKHETRLPLTRAIHRLPSTSRRRLLPEVTSSGGPEMTIVTGPGSDTHSWRLCRHSKR